MQKKLYSKHVVMFVIVILALLLQTREDLTEDVEKLCLIRKYSETYTVSRFVRL